MCARLNCAGIGPLGATAGGIFFFYQLDIIMNLVSSAKWCLLSLLLAVCCSSHSLALPVRIMFLFDSNRRGKNSRTSQNATHLTET